MKKAVLILVIVFDCLASGCYAGITVHRLSGTYDPNEVLLIDKYGQVKQSSFGLKNQVIQKLKPKCTLLDGNGRVAIPEGFCLEQWGHDASIPKGDYVLRIAARCQPQWEQRVTVIPDHYGKQNYLGGSPYNSYELIVPPPSPEKKFVATGTLGSTFTAEDGPGNLTTFPPNTVVDLVRLWPDEQGECTDAIVQIRDAGGALKYRSVHIVALNKLLDSPEPGPSAREYVDAARAKELARQKEVAATKKRESQTQTATESSTGICSHERSVILQQVEAYLKMQMEGAGLFFHFKEITVGPIAGHHRSTLKGNYHLFAVGFSPIRIKAVDRNGNEMAFGSPFHNLGTAYNRDTVAADSVVLTANTNEEHQISVSGEGCMLFMSFYDPKLR